ncbi:MAG: tRNA (adenosine(37)-N6)-threonylcarbamoyltransferase complex dimerization subunit type 1 TsaB [Polaromonas sp.]|uniref:tRNA (adenosine(37)-N6)-threonylcarbamoyltransferase complex dimerization subunit type 1 TsaB n=1 Tax=Polaromonas sp. TaxID=1869339 RepID=UPI0027254CE8|nr:tRNA (adenosine(37)-N6)-threonylcarbamoyltransferase complex dimerization subunit type 1 TsaB [Polaromonas sp.]MDO9113797.1 tRNA (adenosine(37)-N6)-threonylcarbamoyltransferase complex dimerization subunit type 1 TsaB [Polaromonas sp.]
MPADDRAAATYRALGGMSAAEVPKLLAFDTSTERLALALQAPGGPWCLDAAGGAAASATLLPQSLRLLGEAGLQPADLQFVAFGRGPGAFTGLRTACAVAQGLGYGIGCPLLPIDSLLIVAEDARWQAGAGAADGSAPFDVGVAMDARMDEAYAATYRWQGGTWRVLQAPALLTLPALNAAWVGATLQAVAGTAWPAFGARLPVPGGVPVFGEAQRAAALLRLALQAAADGGGVDAADALPLYLRDKVAFTTLERDAQRAATAAAAS